MKSKKQLWDICIEIYQKMYSEAEPKANFKKLWKQGKTSKQGWFYAYYLNQDRQVEIIDKICRKHKLTKREKHQVSKEIHLGCSPGINRKDEK